MDISDTGDFSRLLRDGVYVEAEAVQQFEAIVVRHSKESGQSHYSEQFNLVQGYDLMITRYVVNMSMLTLMVYDPSEEILDELRARGVKLDVTDQEKYDKSLRIEIGRCRDILMRAKIKDAELGEILKETSKKKAKVSYPKLVARLTKNLGVPVNPDTLTLAMYNEYNQIIKEEAQQARRNKAKR